MGIQTFLWAVWTVTREPTLLSCKLCRIFLGSENCLLDACDTDITILRLFPSWRNKLWIFWKTLNNYGIPVLAIHWYGNDFVNRMWPIKLTSDTRPRPLDSKQYSLKELFLRVSEREREREREREWVNYLYQQPAMEVEEWGFL